MKKLKMLVLTLVLVASPLLAMNTAKAAGPNTLSNREIAKPDLIVRGVSFSSTPQAGVPYNGTVTIMIKNIGNAPAHGAMQTYIESSCFTGGYAAHYNIPAGGTQTIDVSWMFAQRVFLASQESIVFTADGPFSQIAESNENNNSLTKTININ